MRTRSSFPAAAVVLLLWAQPRAALAQVPETKSLRLEPSVMGENRELIFDLLKWEESDIKGFERRLAANPQDIPTRLRLMAYHRRADRLQRPEDRAKRVQHLIWLIEHHPDSDLLQYSYSRFSPGEIPAPDYRRVVALWDSAAKARPRDTAVRWNAATFFAGIDPDLHMRYVEATAAADPNHGGALGTLAKLYALAILEGGPRAAHSQAALDASRNYWVVGNAAHMFQNLYNRDLLMGTPNKRAAELAERYFRRAYALNPKLDRKMILPQLDLPKRARAEQAAAQARRDLEARADKAVPRIRRLPPTAFRELPPAVAGVLRARNCTVPQPYPEDPAHNVIRGEFFAKGESGWAVLCSVNNSTTLLAFRNDRDTNPATLSTSEDRTFMKELDSQRYTKKELEEYSPRYARQIAAVNREFMMNRYRSYGGPEAPPIDHLGIYDALLAERTTTWYFHQGKWLQVPGSN